VQFCSTDVLHSQRGSTDRTWNTVRA